TRRTTPCTLPEAFSCTVKALAQSMISGWPSNKSRHWSGPISSSLTTTLSLDNSRSVASSASGALRRADQTLSMASLPNGWQFLYPSSVSPLTWSEDHLTHRSASTRPMSEYVVTLQLLRRLIDRSGRASTRPGRVPPSGLRVCPHGD